jgi:DUF3052 family protein
MAGYSDTPLVDKLGLKAGMRVHFAGAPPDYFKTLGRTPTIIMMTKVKGPLDFVQLFTRSRADLEERFMPITEAMAPDGMFWVSWPKQASKVETDITEDVVREVALKNGLVDVKVCAVDDTWSGLKLVRRLKDR